LCCLNWTNLDKMKNNTILFCRWNYYFYHNDIIDTVREQKYWNDNGVCYKCHLTMLNFRILYIIFPNDFIIILNVRNSLVTSLVFISVFLQKRRLSVRTNNNMLKIPKTTIYNAYPWLDRKCQKIGKKGMFGRSSWPKNS